MTSTLDLFGGDDPAQHGRVALGAQSVVLRGFALPAVDALLAGVDDVIAQAPFRHMETPGGYTMSVALTNCGELGWTTDARGYRYSRIDPVSGQPWPAMPQAFRQLAQDAAREAGFPDFAPDACLVNRYEPGSRLSLHQDRNERDFNAPIVSVSLGMPAMFLFGGDDRADRAARVPLFHGDVVVWGGVDRLRFHGVMPLKDLPHPRLGSQRINFTIRKAG
jgi:alkylated DNA repair protein (DNA oxidative demethylase)